MNPGGLHEEPADDVREDEVFRLNLPKTSDDENSGSMWAVPSQDMNLFSDG